MNKNFSDNEKFERIKSQTANPSLFCGANFNKLLEFSFRICIQYQVTNEDTTIESASVENTTKKLSELTTSSQQSSGGPKPMV